MGTYIFNARGLRGCRCPQQNDTHKTKTTTTLNHHTETAREQASRLYSTHRLGPVHRTMHPCANENEFSVPQHNPPHLTRDSGLEGRVVAPCPSLRTSKDASSRPSSVRASRRASVHVSWACAPTLCPVLTCLEIEISMLVVIRLLVPFFS